MKDLISKQELIDRCNRVIKYGLPDNDGQHQISVEVVLDVVKNLPSETTDLDNVITMIEEDISEYEELMRHHAKPIQDNTKMVIKGLEEAIMIVKEIKLSSTQKTGKWLTDDSGWCKCSECGYTNLVVEVFSFDGYNFCPHCGLKMQRGE